ncbi:MAG TPA: hypothetical protein VHE79_14915 [Spirochaetia bacterium]
MISRKLTPGEISSSVEKIRKKYDEYIARYYRPRSLREAFEARYINALRARVDISSFLIAEIGAIEELIAREEQKIMASPARSGAGKSPTIADKVLDENRRRIAKYPEIKVHGDVSEEVQRLAGALADLARARWQDLGAALQDTMYDRSSSEMLALDSQLHDLAPSGNDPVPDALSRLITELKRFPRNFPAIDREEKEYILQAAFFLNDLYTVLERVKRVYTDISRDTKITIEDARAHVWGIISDFRLKDLKRKRTWEREEPGQ